MPSHSNAASEKLGDDSASREMASGKLTVALRRVAQEASRRLNRDLGTIQIASLAWALRASGLLHVRVEAGSGKDMDLLPQFGKRFLELDKDRSDKFG